MSFRGRNPKLTHYEILGVNENCTQEQLKSAFLELSKRYHPDTNSNDAALHNKFIKINEAYSVLKLSDSRSSYDFGLRQTRAGFTARNQMKYGGYGNASVHYRGRPFYDPSVHPKRNSHYKEEMYYGIKGVSRKPNLLIVGGCIVFIVVGTFLQYAALSRSQPFNRAALLERSNQYSLIYNTTRKRAEENGKDKQLELFEQQFKSDGVD